MGRHSEAASSVAVPLGDLLNANVNKISQTQFVHQMNQEFGSLGGASKLQTAVVATFFRPQNSLSIDVAGRPYPINYRSSKQTWVHLDPAEPDQGLENLPLGGIRTRITPDERLRQMLETGSCFKRRLHPIGELCGAVSRKPVRSRITKRIRSIRSRGIHSFSRGQDWRYGGPLPPVCGYAADVSPVIPDCKRKAIKYAPEYANVRVGKQKAQKNCKK